MLLSFLLVVLNDVLLTRLSILVEPMDRLPSVVKRRREKGRLSYIFGRKKEHKMLILLSRVIISL